MELIHPVTGEISAEPNLSLELPSDQTFDDWCEFGRNLRGADKVINWWIGDWWNFGGHYYGDRAEAAARGIFGKEYETLRGCGWVASKFESVRRRTDLSFSHHKEVSALAPVEADGLLDMAEHEGWSRKRLRAAVNQARVEIGEQPSSETCTTEDLHQLIMRGSRFGAIYADPPWLYDNQGTRAATGNHYGGLTVDQLCELPIGELAADDAHLHLWTTNAFLFDCQRIFAAWGFEYRSAFVWVKPQLGIGNYWRNSHEYLLTAIRGNAKRFNDHSLKSWLECDRGAHSAKPEQVRHMIERASPGPYLEMFGRLPAPRWTVWGNQIRRDLLLHDVEEIAA